MFFSDQYGLHIIIIRVSISIPFIGINKKDNLLSQNPIVQVEVILRPSISLIENCSEYFDVSSYKDKQILVEMKVFIFAKFKSQTFT